jgi:hypothetical protein
VENGYAPVDVCPVIEEHVGNMRDDVVVVGHALVGPSSTALTKGDLRPARPNPKQIYFWIKIFISKLIQTEPRAPLISYMMSFKYNDTKININYRIYLEKYCIQLETNEVIITKY